MSILQPKHPRVFKPLSSNHKKLAIIFVCIISCLFVFAIMPNSAFADNSSSTDYVETTFFGNLKDDGQGCGIYTVINLVVDIMSMGVGILGVIGIIIVGIQYLTAKDNESQVQKSKRRIGEIVIGLVAFAVLFALTQWLLPGGRLNNDAQCETISDEDLAELKESEQEAKAEKNDEDSDDDSKSGYVPVGKKGANSVPNTAPYLKESKFNRECLRDTSLTTTGEKIACILNKISKWADDNNVHYGNKAWRGKNKLMNCATFTTAAYIEAGLLKKGDYFAMMGDTVQNWSSVKKRGTLVKTNVANGTKIKTLAKQNKLLPGDTIGLASHHTYMYIGKNSSGKHMCQQLGRGQTIFNNGTHQHSKSKFECGNKSVYTIVHPKRSITISL